MQPFQFFNQLLFLHLIMIKHYMKYLNTDVCRTGDKTVACTCLHILWCLVCERTIVIQSDSSAGIKNVDGILKLITFEAGDLMSFSYMCQSKAELTISASWKMKIYVYKRFCTSRFFPLILKWMKMTLFYFFKSFIFVNEYFSIISKWLSNFQFNKLNMKWAPLVAFWIMF